MITVPNIPPKEPRSFFVPGRLMMESLIWKYRIPGSVCLPKMFPICSSVFTVLTKPAAIREQGLGFLSPGGSLTGIMDVLQSFPVQDLAPGSGSYFLDFISPCMEKECTDQHSQRYAKNDSKAACQSLHNGNSYII